MWKRESKAHRESNCWLLTVCSLYVCCDSFSKSSCPRPSFSSYCCRATSWHQQWGLNTFSLLPFLFLLVFSHFLSLQQFSNAETKFASLSFAFPLSIDQPCCFITDSVVLTTIQTEALSRRASWDFPALLHNWSFCSTTFLFVFKD